MSEKNKQKNPRLGKVGGQAVLEGVMMRSGDEVAIASRMPDKSIKITRQKFVSARKKHKALNIPLLRGVINFVEMMMLSFKTLDASTAALGLEEEEPSKFEKWLEKVFGKSIMKVIMVISTILGVLLAVGLFFVLPTYCRAGVSWIGQRLSGDKFILSDNPFLVSLVEGLLKIIIFIVYLALISLMGDIKKTFQYHGAEHKSVFCYEKGLELTVANVKKQSRFHPRCGTSFMFIMILIGIAVGLLIPTGISPVLRSLIKILLMPITVGVGFEFILLAGKHDNVLTRILSAPGLWVQRLTTKEPSDDQIECAIAALKCAIPAEFPNAEKEYEAQEQASEEASTEGE